MSQPTTSRFRSRLADELFPSDRLDSAIYRVAYDQHAHASRMQPSEHGVCWIELVIARRWIIRLDDFRGERRSFDQGQTWLIGREMQFHNMICDDTDGKRTNGADRRLRPTSPFDAIWRGGRRKRPRRQQERRDTYYVDRFDALTLVMIVSLLVLTIADGVLTIELVDTNSEEVNPVMAHLLLQGNNVFLLGKFILTAAGLPLLVAYKNYRMFGTRFRAGFFIPLFVSLYIVLVFYQAQLLHFGRHGSPSSVQISSTEQVKDG